MRFFNSKDPHYSPPTSPTSPKPKGMYFIFVAKKYLRTNCGENAFSEGQVCAPGNNGSLKISFQPTFTLCVCKLPASVFKTLFVHDQKVKC